MMEIEGHLHNRIADIFLTSTGFVSYGRDSDIPANITNLHSFHDLYCYHMMNLKGAIVWTTLKNPLTCERTIIGENIKTILTPDQHIKYWQTLFSCLQDDRWHWHEYQIEHQKFLVLVKYLIRDKLFLIHEAKIMDKSLRNMKFLRHMLLSMAGEFDQAEQYKQNGTE